MNILALTSLYPHPGRELYAPYNRLQFAALGRRHEVSVVSPVAWPERVRWRGLFAGTPDPLVRDGLRVYHPTYYFPPRLLRSGYGHWYVASVRRVVRRVIREARPDAILTCWAHPDGWAAARLARAAGLPVLLKVIGSDLLVVTGDRRRRARVAESLRGVDGVVAVSRDLADHAVSLGAPTDRVHVVHEGTDLDLFRPGDRAEARSRLGLPAEGRVLLFVGNVLFSKGAGVLVEACRVLTERGAEFRCYLVGRGADETAVRQLVDRYGLGGRVILAGARPQADLPDWYRAADLVVLPSYSEGIPNVLREALACGRPFVATRVGGIPEITRPPAGRLVPPGDPTALADAVQRVLADPPVVDEAARAVNITWDESARLIAQQLENILPHRATG